MNNVINILGDKKIWLLWRKQFIKGKQTKVPYQPNGIKAESNNQTTWNTYKEVSKVKGFDGIGLMLNEKSSVVGIDLDHIKNDKGISNEYVKNFIVESETYIEKSPSGDGLHALYILSDYKNLELPIKKTPKKNQDKYGQFEVYKNLRYFTFTEDVYGDNDTIKTVTSKEFIDKIKILGYPWGYEENTAEQNQQLAPLNQKTVLDIMFNSKNGKKIKELYNGDISQYSNDYSSAEQALLSHLAFYTRKNTQQIETIWLQSPLGKREKTQKRKDYRDRSIKTALKNCTNVYKQKQEKIDFLMGETKDGNPYIRRISTNVEKVFEHHENIKNRLRYNYFAGVPEIFINKIWIPIENHLMRDIITEIQLLYPTFDIGFDNIIKDVALTYSFKNRISPPLEYIKTLIWDKKPRIDKWLHKVFCVPDIDYYTYIGRSWLKYMMKRLAYPGCKFDHVLIIKGNQGFGKSTILEKLCILDGKSYFNETTDSPDNSKEFSITLQNNILVEFGEGAITGYKDQKKVKSFITKTIDKYRPPYMKSSQEFPRQCVFSMTINDEEFLKDKTGERRYWIVSVPEEIEIGNIQYIVDNSLQMLAEAFTLIDEPYQYMNSDAEKYKNELIQQHKEIDPLEDLVVEWYFSLDEEYRENGVGIRDAQDKITDDKLRSKYLSRDISKVFTSILNLKQGRVRDTDNSNRRLYFPTKKTEKKDVIINNNKFNDF